MAVAAVLLISTTCQYNFNMNLNVPNIQLYPGINYVKIQYDNFNREFIVHLPQTYENQSLYPIVMVFHGLGGSSSFGIGTMGTLVDRENFIGIYPQGRYGSWNTGNTNLPSSADDVGFTRRILEWLDSRIAIDRDRIYALGYSNGGAFSYVLARRMDEIASIAALSASFRKGQIIDPDVSKKSIMQIHGELDTEVPYYGGKSSSLTVSFESAPYTVKQWAIHDGIAEYLQTFNPENKLTVYKYEKEDNPLEVLLYCLRETTHDIGQHSFVNNNRCYLEIWEFFKKHSKKDREME
jgi:polyhydroxybutyrate depolymerase